MTYDADPFRESLTHADHLAIYGYWQSKRTPGRLPGRAEIDPTALRGLLPRIALIDVLAQPDGPAFRFRLAGTELVQRGGQDPTGRRFDEIYRGEYLEQVQAVYREVVDAGAPRLIHRVYPLVPEREYLRYERLLLPLAGDGVRVDMVLLLVAVSRQRASELPDPGARPAG
jgi:hypothetical protein